MKKIDIRIALLLLLLDAIAALAAPHAIEPPGPPSGRTQTASFESVSNGSARSPSQSFEREASSGGPEFSSAVPLSQGAASGKKASSSPAAGLSAAAASGNSALPEFQPPRTVPQLFSPSASVSALMPEAPGTSVFSQEGAEIDYSNSSQGYMIARYSGNAKVKVLVYYNGGSSYYQYSLSGNVCQTLPLQSGSGSYRVRFMQNLSGDTYAELCSTTIAASVVGAGCNLYPNQFVDYTGSSAAVKEAQILCAHSGSNAQKVAAIYRYITTTIQYDYDKAGSVTSGYLPNVDATLAARRGICFDYAALMAAMCRSQRIPARLVIGDTSCGYHAWDEVYLNGWVRYDPTLAAAGQTAGTYTPQKYY